MLPIPDNCQARHRPKISRSPAFRTVGFLNFLNCLVWTISVHFFQLLNPWVCALHTQQTQNRPDSGCRRTLIRKPQSGTPPFCLFENHTKLLPPNTCTNLSQFSLNPLGKGVCVCDYWVTESSAEHCLPEICSSLLLFLQQPARTFASAPLNWWFGLAVRGFKF